MKKEAKIKEEFLHALKSNSMTTSEPLFKYLWRPNNYRRQIKIKGLTNSAKFTTIKPLFPMENININNHTRLVSIKASNNITLQIGKETITGIWSQDKVGGSKLTHLIEGSRLEDVEEFINNKKQEIKERIDTAIRRVYNAFGGRGGSIQWSRHEDWIKGGEFINSLPRECIIHDTVFKKVYGEGIEFTGGKDKEPTVSIKNYVKNHVIKEVAPEIAQKLNLINPLGALKQEFKDFTDLDRLEPLIKILSMEERLDFERWLFIKFGISST